MYDPLGEATESDIRNKTQNTIWGGTDNATWRTITRETGGVIWSVAERMTRAATRNATEAASPVAIGNVLNV